ncbi:MAG: DUF885 family protein [Candidatus Aminicenantales bacterium]
MKKVLRVSSIALVVLIGSALVTCQNGKKASHPGEPTDASQSSKILGQVSDAYWSRLLEDSLYLRLKKGLRIYKFPDVSYSYAQNQYGFVLSLLDQLDQVDPDDLTYEEFLSYEILNWDLSMLQKGFRFFWHYIPVTPYASPLTLVHRVFTTFAFQTQEDLDHYLKLLKLYAEFIHSLQEKMKVQMGKGILLPKEELALVNGFLRSFIQPPQKSLFFVPGKRLSHLESADGDAFQRKVAETIRTKVNPALRSLASFLDGDYKDMAPDDVGLWQYPDGKDYYRYLIRLHTTLDLAPEKIHEIGLDQVKAFSEKVDAIRKRLGFSGSLEEFRRFLKTDPRFALKSAKELGTRLEHFMELMRERIPEFFLSVPKTPYGVKRLSPELETSMTFGYYQPPTASNPTGTYLYNGRNLSNQAFLSAESLIYHELVPGHHFHIASQYENPTLPEFRKEALYSAFTEGWAEYAAWLAHEMGLYKDPYSLCGRYQMEIFLFTRLVVDTGMNALEWPRSRAVGFMRQHLLESDQQIHTETLRYGADIPGQGLAYKLGSMTFIALRKKAEKALGKRFNIKRFHQALLSSGSMPLPVLERHIDRFIEREKKKAADAPSYPR